MKAVQRLRDRLSEALLGPGSAEEFADRLCDACVNLLKVDGAAISVIQNKTSQGTFGSSSQMSRHLDELQFTLGEGPCLDSVAQDCSVLAADLADPSELRWPMFSNAVLRVGVHAVFAFPVQIDAGPYGALDLFRASAGALSELDLGGATWAAELASLPLLQVIGNVDQWFETGSELGKRPQLGMLERVEVYQATGMIVAQLGVGPREALLRIRAYAFANDLTASEVSWRIVDRRLLFDAYVARETMTGTPENGPNG